MDITEQEIQKTIKMAVIGALKEVLDKGHDLGGMADYGNGWNDRGTQVKMIVKEMIERWEK